MPNIQVAYVADTSGLAKATGDIEDAGGRTSKTMKGVGAAVASGLAIGAVVSFGKASVTAAQESEVATNRLEQVFKSMGDSTGEAAKGAIAYAGALSRKTAIEDETIMASQALLATFSNVSNAAARQAGIFDRATAAAADLSATGFGSMDSSAKMLGKALQDPVKGLTALGKAGVTFTEAQKEQIAVLVKSGDTLKAQQIIMGEVEKQVGGVAAATATDTAKMSVAFGELQEQVGTALLPVISKLVDILMPVLGLFQQYPGVLTALVVGVAAVAVAITVMNVALAVTAVVTSPITLTILAIVAAIALLAAGVYLLYKNWDTVMTAIKSAAVGVFNWLKSNWPLLLPILLGPLGVILAAVITNWSAIRETIVSAVNAVRSAVSTAWGAITGIISSAAGVITGAINTIKTAFNSVRTAVDALVDVFRGPLSSAANAAKSALSGLSGVLSSIAGAFNTAASAVEGLISAIGRIPSKISLPSLPDLPGPLMAAPAGVATAATGLAAAPTATTQTMPTSGGRAPLEVRVYIGDTELKGIVRHTVRDATGSIARTLLAGSS